MRTLSLNPESNHIKIAKIIATTGFPNSKKPEEAIPKKSQKIYLINLFEKPWATEVPKIKKVVRNNPIVPEYKGVYPLNNKKTNTIKGKIKYHLVLIAFKADGNSYFGRPTRFFLPASKCTIQNADK